MTVCETFVGGDFAGGDFAGEDFAGEDFAGLTISDNLDVRYFFRIERFALALIPYFFESRVSPARP